VLTVCKIKLYICLKETRLSQFTYIQLPTLIHPKARDKSELVHSSDIDNGEAFKAVFEAMSSENVYLTKLHLL